jgi:hypothetical protein
VGDVVAAAILNRDVLAAGEVGFVRVVAGD